MKHGGEVSAILNSHKRLSGRKSAQDEGRVSSSDNNRPAHLLSGTTTFGMKGAYHTLSCTLCEPTTAATAAHSTTELSPSTRKDSQC